jgi:hypothetical protein
MAPRHTRARDIWTSQRTGGCNAVTTIGNIRLLSYSREILIPRRGEIDTYEPNKDVSAVKETQKQRDIVNRTLNITAGFPVRWWYLQQTRHTVMLGQAHPKVHVLGRAPDDEPAEKSAPLLDPSTHRIPR